MDSMIYLVKFYGISPKKNKEKKNIEKSMCQLWSVMFEYKMYIDSGIMIYGQKYRFFFVQTFIIKLKFKRFDNQCSRIYHNLPFVGRSMALK